MAHDAKDARKAWFHGTFTQIPNAVFAQIPDMSASVFTTYCVLAKHADKDGRCYPHIKTLAEETGASIRTINRDLNELQRRGLIHRRRTQYKNAYTLLDPEATPMSHLRSDTHVVSQDSDAPPVSHEKRHSRRMRSDTGGAYMRTTPRELHTEELDNPPTPQGEESAPSLSFPSDQFDEPDDLLEEDPWEGGRTDEDGGRERKEDDVSSVSKYPGTGYWTASRDDRFAWTFHYLVNCWDGMLFADAQEIAHELQDEWLRESWEHTYRDQLDTFPQDCFRAQIDQMREAGKLTGNVSGFLLTLTGLNVTQPERP